MKRFLSLLSVVALSGCFSSREGGLAPVSYGTAEQAIAHTKGTPVKSSAPKAQATKTAASAGIIQAEKLDNPYASPAALEGSPAADADAPFKDGDDFTPAVGTAKRASKGGSLAASLGSKKKPAVKKGVVPIEEDVVEDVDPAPAKKGMAPKKMGVDPASVHEDMPATVMPAKKKALEAPAAIDESAVLDKENIPPVAAPEPASSALGVTQFQWPLKGDVITTFGKDAKGLQNDGINIKAPAGAPVTAAEEGLVAYAGNELQGFGNLVLIKHADGWMSAYAHTSKVLVSKGQKVKKGDKIALVGATGSVKSPQLHFELRRKSKAVDPMGYLE